MGNIEARVTNSSGAPASSATVVLIPDAPLRERLDLFREATTNEAGKVQIERELFLEATSYSRGRRSNPENAGIRNS